VSGTHLHSEPEEGILRLRGYRLSLATIVALLALTAAALASTGSLDPEGCVAGTASNPDGCAQTAKGLDGPYSVAVSADGKSVYVAGTSDSAIVRFNRNATSGALTPNGCVADPVNNPDGCTKTAPGLDNADWVTVSPDGTSVYAVGGGDNAIVLFGRVL